MKVEVAVLSSPSLTVRTVSVDVKYVPLKNRTMELCKDEVDVLGSPSPSGRCGLKATLKRKQCCSALVDIACFDVTTGNVTNWRISELRLIG